MGLDDIRCPFCEDLNDRNTNPYEQDEEKIICKGCGKAFTHRVKIEISKYRPKGPTITVMLEHGAICCDNPVSLEFDKEIGFLHHTCEQCGCTAKVELAANCNDTIWTYLNKNHRPYFGMVKISNCEICDYKNSHYQDTISKHNFYFCKKCGFAEGMRDMDDSRISVSREECPKCGKNTYYCSSSEWNELNICYACDLYESKKWEKDYYS